MIVIVRDVDGSLRCETDPPPEFVAFTPQLVDLLRRGGSVWTTINDATITMWVKPEPLHYRLTGETDFAGGLAAQRVTADGKPWYGPEADDAVRL